MNVVRMGFHWHMVEPSQGQFNTTYIDSVVEMVERLNNHSVHVFLDMHQDCWSPLFCQAHGLPSDYSHGYSSDYNPGGSKAYPQPLYKPTYDPQGHQTNCDGVSKHLFGWASCYVTYAVGAAAQRLYDNDKGILDRFGEFWKLIASKVKDYPNVLGYELLNEPWLGDVPLNFEEFIPDNPNWNLWFPKESDKRNLKPMYKKLHEYIRSVDNDTIIFFEPATGGNFLDAWPVGFDEGPGGVEYNDRQALSYHIYCLYVDEKQSTNFLQYILANLSVLACDVMDNEMYDIRKSDTDNLNLAGFLTEFGGSPTDGDGELAEDLINFTAEKMDDFMHGWTFWYLTPDPKVNNSRKIRALARPYPQKVSGTPLYYNFNPKTKVFRMEYIPCADKPCIDLPTEVFTSKNYVYAGSLHYSIDTECEVKNYMNDTLQLWYVQTVNLTASCTVMLTITP